MTKDEGGGGTGRPRPQVTIYLLGFVALAGLVAQAIAAESAFALLGRGMLYSVSAALLIEMTAALEGLIAIRYGDWLAAGLLGLTLVISGIYNYAQANEAAAHLFWLVKLALAVGPLVALVSVGSMLGAELREYEGRVATWREGQAERQALEEAQARQQEQQRIAFEQEQERKRLEHELREAELATRRQERWERNRRLTQMNADGSRGRTVAGQGEDGRTVTGQVSGVTGQWPDKAAFLADPGRPDGLTGPELAAMAGISDRTARRWLAEAKNGHGTADGHGPQINADERRWGGQ